jgi:hypothetical protein
MGAALLELVARGEQDIPLIGNPNMTYFKNIYKRHTNFSMETIEINFNDAVDFGKQTSTYIDKKGDLLNKIFIELDLPALTTNISWINGIGHHIIEYIELRFGGVLIDKIYGELLDIWSELTVPYGLQGTYYKMVGKFGSYNKSTQSGALKLFIPVPFWFCNDISRSLPLISMQYTDIKITVKFRPYTEMYNLRGLTTSETSTIPSSKEFVGCRLLCDFIFLDVYERRQFAGMKESITLIEQFQISENHGVLANQSSINIPLNFNHTVKELIWFYRSDTNISSYNDRGNYAGDSTTSSILKPFTTVELKFNGNDRFTKRAGDFFRFVQPYKHHTTGHEDFIYTYSFALKPEELQPSGTCNFSKINSAVLVLPLSSGIDTGVITVYAYGYNVLKIKNGMAGLMYSS